MEGLIRRARADVLDYQKQLESDKATETADPQWQYAKEFFKYFLEHPDTPTGKKAGESAFMMWANLGAVEEIEAAMPQISNDSTLWRRILNSVGNAYARSDRGPEYKELLSRLEDKLTDPGSRSALLLRLSGSFRFRNQPDTERAYLEKVVALNANPYDVQQAEGALYEMRALNVGQPAPDFEAETIDGKIASLSGLSGKFVLLEFWATWCGPCMPEIPPLKTLEKELPPTHFQIIGISKDEDLEVLRRFIEDGEISWPQIQQVAEFEGEKLNQDEILKLYNVFGIPRSFLIDPQGMIAAKDLRGEQLESEVRRLVMNAVKRE